MEISFTCQLTIPQQQIVLESRIYQNWLNSLDAKILIESIEIQSVDFIGRQSDQVLFIKLKALANDPEGHQIPGVVLLRGAAVCILPVLYTELEPYVVLVRQARLGTGLLGSLEIPAGILDVQMNLVDLASKELFEETGLEVEANDLKDMLELLESEHSHLFSSIGISDETLGYYLYERAMKPGEFEELQGRLRTLESENEYIRVELLPISAAKKHLRDSKSLLAILLYESLKWSQDL